MMLSFTTNREEDNPAHREASSFLLSLEKERVEPRTVDNTEIMKKFYSEGQNFLLFLSQIVRFSKII